MDTTQNKTARSGAAGTTRPNYTQTIASVSSIEQALSFIDAHDQKTWVDCGMAIKSELGDAGFDAWDRWSATADNYRARDAATRWKSFKASGGITIATLFKLAMDNGYVRDISERMQCPPDFAAVAVLVMMATIIGRKVGIRPKRKDNWTVICNLWAAVVGNSGVMKSPTLAAALSPLGKLVAAAFEIFKKAKSEYDAQVEFAKVKESVNMSKAKASLKKDDKADVKSLLQSSGTEDAPILKRYKTNNASYEALGELLMENPNGLLVESDEIIGLLKQLDAGGQEVARSFYLTAADGDKGYTFDRITLGYGAKAEGSFIAFCALFDASAIAMARGLRGLLQAP